MNGESKRREFRSYDPKNGRGTKDDDEDEKDWDRTLNTYAWLVRYRSNGRIGQTGAATENEQ